MTFSYLKILKKNIRTISSGVFTSKNKKKILKLLVLAFLYIELNKNTRNN
jgi:hypothetical protein